MWESIAGSTFSQYRQTDQYVNGPFIIHLMHVGFTCNAQSEGA